MIPWIADQLQNFFGPFRLLSAYSTLIVLGLYGGFFLSYFLLPKFFRLLPQDRGREFAVENSKAKGKPTGAGVIFITIFVIVSFLCVPFGLKQSLILVLTLIVMLSGYLDDKSSRSWGEYQKGAIDLILSVAGALVLSMGKDVTIWLPFTANVIVVPFLLFLPLASLLIWVSINATNCSDGVDGLSGTLVILALISLGLITYFVLGHTKIAGYLLLPHYPDGAKWAILIFTLVGSLAAYLWYNAYPSKVLMGDAGSRALGFFIGISVLNTGNPFILFIISTVLLVNGGTGIVKVGLLRFLKIRILHNTRFPLHDHMREYRQWSNSQVLIKFVIIQILVTVGLLGVFFKVR